MKTDIRLESDTLLSGPTKMEVCVSVDFSTLSTTEIDVFISVEFTDFGALVPSFSDDTTMNV